MNQFALRIDHLDESTTEQFMKFLDQYDASYCIAREGFNTFNPHFHLYIETRITGPQLRQRLRDLGYSGNATYSLKTATKDPVKYICYMLKDGDFLNFGIDTDMIEAAKERNDEIKANKSRASKRPSWRIIMDDYLDSMVYPSEEQDYWIKIAILNYHNDKEIAIRRSQLKVLYDTIRFFKNPAPGLHMDLFL